MKVLAFGTFDPLHEGHVHFFGQAKRHGDYLLVVVARDSAIREIKRREPHRDEETRLAAVQRLDEVDEARLGEDWPASDEFGLLGELDFDVIVLGYDQRPSEQKVTQELAARGKSKVKVVRLDPWQDDEFKSSKFR